MTADMGKTLDSDATKLGSLIIGMRAAFARGENVMEYARKALGENVNLATVTLIAYDLQAGSYTQGALENPDGRDTWCGQLADILNPLLQKGDTLLEVGCGEATTLAGVLQHLHHAPRAYGFDISWSRCAYGLNWLAEKKVRADLFVADLFEIPLEDSSIDIVYTSHSLEPNGGREEAALKELLRIARKAVVLVEPAYELANTDAQARMRQHGYVRDLKKTAQALGAKVTDYRLLDVTVNPLNPSGLLLIEKSTNSLSSNVQWRCPLTRSPLVVNEIGFYSPSTGVAYPVFAGVPLLRTNHAIVASAFEPQMLKQFGSHQ